MNTAGKEVQKLSSKIFQFLRVRKTKTMLQKKSNKEIDEVGESRESGDPEARSERMISQVIFSEN